MKLKQALYLYCRNNKLEDISCLIHLSFLNYISSYKTTIEWININPELIAIPLGLDEKIIENLLKDLSNNYSEVIQKDYRFFCPAKIEDENSYEYCDSISENDFKEEYFFEADCSACGDMHEFEYENINKYKYEIGYIGHKEKLLKELSLSEQDILKELLIINTNENNLDKLANLIVEKIAQEKQINKDETKKGILKLLYLTKETTGLIKGISGDAADTITNVRKIAEEFSGIGIIKDLF
ncbi:hypothetical protein C3L23_06235 [Nautilia sp. PV-1]|uniref:hypothetical protein n=1 Tax=Nautilia sp. PV-1 TaxID=2579250 RepID=UPI000FDA50F5|nr:hypothetical protein [Nautilia sp. PV-1]AZV46885.1 hypothetical protein C3L23_06235 [Nautilia sp. PV-1]